MYTTVLFAVIIGVCYGARLENTYLPPGSAVSAGGTGQFLSAPKQSFTTNTFSGFTGSTNNKYQQNSFDTYQTNTYKTQEHIPILKYNNDNFNGQYRYEYETANGIMAHEEGHQKDYDNQEVHGGYSYTAPDGQQVSVQYIANENGFQPVGSHIPGIPEAIKKSLEFNAQEEARGVVDNGAYKSEHHQDVSVQTPGQYLPPVVVDAKSSNNQYSAPKNGNPWNQYVAPKINNQYLAPKVGNQYLAPRVNNQAPWVNNQTPKVNNQYLAPKVNNQAPKVNIQYLAPKVNNQYLAPRVNNQYISPKNSYGTAIPKPNDQFLAPKSNQFTETSSNPWNNGYSGTHSFVPAPQVNNQYLTPNKQSFSSKTGYHY